MIDKLNAAERSYCDAIARAGTTEDVQRVIDRLAAAFSMVAAYLADQKRMKALIAEDQARLREDEQMLAQRRAASPLPQAEFDQANAQFEQQVANRRGKLQNDQQRAEDLDQKVEQSAPYVIGARSRTMAVRVSVRGGGSGGIPAAPAPRQDARRP